ncbi:MAG: hypothetical protein E7624_01895 [Ruminococcaceae bacterium]|nr:hypothetical protein [Oscillospiraceae bacterium]
MKKSTRILTLFTALLLCLLGMALFNSCDEPVKTTEIYITNADQPRLNYVEGQELDLSDGKLTVATDGKESKLPLDSPDITVEGYDKKKIGDQTLTVKYGELTTTIKVNVIERAIAEGFETKYFVGDEFNKNMGKIRIATDDAKSFKVNMNDAKVSLVSFDSSVAGTATVTVLYNDGSNSYYCQFDVTVYDQSNIQFTPPQKTTYFSHDTAVSVNGGYFTVTSSDATLTKNVPLTETMVTDFDLSAATLENRTTPLEQPVTVTYLGKTFQYNIFVTFSEVSVLQYYETNTLSKIDWEKVKKDGLTDAQSEVALDAIHTYLDLSDAQKEMISDELATSVIRAGSVALSNAFLKEVNNYSKTFTMDAELNLYLTCSDYEQTKADLAILSDSDAKINTYATLLREIEAAYGTLVVEGETTVADCIYVYTEEMQEHLISVLTHFVEVFELVADIPDSWTVDTLKEHSADIRSATMKIYNAGFYKSGYSRYYTNLLSPWRENNDLFEILYSYFLYAYEEDGQEFMVNYMWGSMPMPGLLESWYAGLSGAIAYEKYYAANYASAALLADVSGFMYYYFSTLEIAEEIKASENQLWIDIYNAYNGDYMNQIYMYTPSYGYLYHAKGMVDSEAYHKMWKTYYPVLKAALNDKLSATVDKAEICAMFDAFQALSPSELLGFLSSMHLMYTNAKGVLPMLQYNGEKVYSILMLVMKEYYTTYLNKSTEPLFQKLLLAMENFALIGYKDGALDEFKTLMKELVDAYTPLSDADKENFNKYAGISYQKYLALYNAATSGSDLTLTDTEKALFDELKLAIDKYFTAYNYMYELATKKDEVPAELYPVLYSLYAKVNELYGRVTGENASLALYLNVYEILGGEYSLAVAFHMLDTTTTSMLTGQKATITNTDGTVSYVTYWDLMMNYDLEPLFVYAADLLYYAYFDKEAVPQNSYVLTLMGDVRTMTDFQRNIFSFLKADSAYYTALNTYFTAVMTNADVAASLIEAEKAYFAYLLDKENTELRDAFLATMEGMDTAYGALSDADKAYVKEAYNYYLSVYQELTATPAA